VLEIAAREDAGLVKAHAPSEGAHARDARRLVDLPRAPTKMLPALMLGAGGQLSGREPTERELEGLGFGRRSGHVRDTIHQFEDLLRPVSRFRTSALTGRSIV